MANWKVFGPTAEYSDGDADFYRVTNQLSDQYEWFAPGREPQPQAAEDAEQAESSEYGLTPNQIAALGLSGSRNSVDSVRGWHRTPCVHTWRGHAWCACLLSALPGSARLLSCQGNGQGA